MIIHRENTGAKNKKASAKALMRKQGKRRRLSPCHWISVVVEEQG
jgi:hypothetical protein